MAIGYKYNYRRVLGFIATEGYGSNEPGYPYLSSVPEIYSNVSVRPIVIPHLIGRYLNTYNMIDNRNRMRQYSLGLEKYWVTQSGNFRLENKVSLCMGITYGKLLFCHRI